MFYDTKIWVKFTFGPYGFIQESNVDLTRFFSESACTDDAMQQTESMIEKMIASKSSPFSDYKQIERNGMNICSFKGMGQEHHIFRISKSIYWISANHGTIDELRKNIVG